MSRNAFYLDVYKNNPNQLKLDLIDLKPIAIGTIEQPINQKECGIAIGQYAGFWQQRTCAIAIGEYAGHTSQGEDAIAIGGNAGQSAQGTGAIAIGTEAGDSVQSEHCIAIGSGAGNFSQQLQSVAIGYNSGYTYQGEYSVAIGSGAGQYTQRAQSIAIGYQAGYTNQSNNAIAIGYQAGSVQALDAVAIGSQAGSASQGSSSIAIGPQAGLQYQNSNAVAIGPQAGLQYQNSNAVAIGSQAGYTNQGQYAIAIGYNAGKTNQTAQSIALNATSTVWTPASTGFFVKPVRNIAGSANMFYNAGTGEITYQVSSQRYKENIVNLQQNTSKVLDVQAREFDLKNSGHHRLGYIAEELHELDPHFTHVNQQGEPEGIEWNNLLVYLIEQVKVLKARVDELESNKELAEALVPVEEPVRNVKTTEEPAHVPVSEHVVEPAPRQSEFLKLINKKLNSKGK
jgi:hypothetical protein